MGPAVSHRLHSYLLKRLIPCLFHSLSGRIYQAPTVGDVDGDGLLDVVVAVAALEGYHIYAVRGDTGKERRDAKKLLK